MAESMIMPKLGFNMSEGKLVKWYKSEGEAVRKGEPVFAIETDKTTIDIEATGDGILRAVLVNEGETVSVTLPVAIFAEVGESIEEEVRSAMALLGKAGPTTFPAESAAPSPLSSSVSPASASGPSQAFDFDILVIGGGPGGYVAAIKAARLVGGVGGLLAKNGVTKISGEAALLDKNTVEAGGKTYTATNLILATGSTSKSLPIPMDGSVEILTSTEMLNIEEVPERVAVIGGGVIGIEFAYFLANLGVKVTVIEFLDRILPMVDEEITAQVASLLAELGVTIHTSAKVTEVKNGAVLFEKAGTTETVAADKVLLSVGRAPSLFGVDCEKLGIRTERGAIVTDSALKTTVDNIYAIGDVNGKAMLAHCASMEGIIAVENICGHASSMRYDRIPTAIYIQPEIASVGLTETQAREKYGDIKVGKFPLAANGKAMIDGETRGFIKVIAEAAYGEIVGVHIFGLHATDMIAESVVAMNLEATAEEVAASIHPHPTVSEICQEAFHAVTGKAIHF